MKKNGKLGFLDPTFKNIKKVVVFNLLFFSLVIIAFAGYLEHLIEDRDDQLEKSKLVVIQSELNRKISQDLNHFNANSTVKIETLNDVDVMARIHLQLLNGDKKLGLVKIEDPDLLQILKNISLAHQQMYSLLAAGDSVPLDQEELAEFHKNQKFYQRGIDKIKNTLIANLQLRFLNLRKTVFLLVVLFITIIFLNYRIFIRPIIRNVRLLSEEREQQAGRLGSILENTNNGIWSVDLDCNLIAFNSVFSNIIIKHSGVVPKMGEKVFGLTRFDCEPFYRKAFNGEIFSTDFKFELEGNITYHELSFHPIYDNHKQVTGCSVYQIDITQRVVALEELRLSEHHLKEAQEITSMGNWNWNMVDGKIEWSEQFFRLCGKNPLDYKPDFEGFFSIIHPDDRESVREGLQRDLENYESHDATYRIVRNKGEVRYLYTRGKFFYDENGKPYRMAGTTQDITAMEIARTKILKQNGELQNFVHVVSHNLRAPVSTLKLLIDLQNGSYNDSMSDAELFRLMGNTVNSIYETLSDLNHTLSLKNTDRQQLEEVSLADVLLQIKFLLANEIESYNILIVQDFSKVPKVQGIKAYFSNIIFNLIQNAIHYRSLERTPKIIISSKALPDGLMSISIEDNGIGMELDDIRRKRIFDMYGRLSGSTPGKGMGLYLVKTQVEAMEGEIIVESTLGAGSVFTVFFKNKILKQDNILKPAIGM